MTNKLFIGSLSYDVTDAQLQEHFAQAGTVLSAKVITDRYTGRSKGFGFVEMTTAEEAQNAIDTLNNSNLAGRSIIVNEAKPQEPRENRSFGSDNRGGYGGGHGGGNNRDRNRRNDNRSGNNRNSW